jgi:hypothetical protein
MTHHPARPLHAQATMTHWQQRRRLMLGTLALGLAPWAQAQSPAPVDSAGDPAPDLPVLQGSTVDGQRLALSGMRGQVVLVFHWATDCAVCRDKMHEMRANLAGWSGAPFRLLGVNWDARRSELARYEALVRQTIPAPQRLTSIWAGDASFQSSTTRPTHLPMAQLIDKQGRLVETYSGRIPPEAWDRIAALL